MTHIDTPVLLGCPFCGEEYPIIGINCEPGDGERPDTYYVSCRTMGCHAGIFQMGYWQYKTREKAIEAWNTRAPLDGAAAYDKDAEIARLRGALEEIRDSKYCIYENTENSQYGIGVADGHRYCRKIASKALNTTGDAT